MAACFLRFLGSVLPNFHLALLFPLSLFCAIFIPLSVSPYCKVLLWKWPWQVSLDSSHREYSCPYNSC